MSHSERLLAAMALAILTLIISVFLVGISSTPVQQGTVPHPAPGPAVPDPGVRPELLP